MNRFVKCATVSGISDSGKIAVVYSGGIASGYIPCVSNEETMPYAVGDKVAVVDEIVIGKIFGR